MKAQFVQTGDAIDYTPVSAVSAGDVIVIGGVVYIAKLDIAANVLGALATEGVFDVAKITGAIAAGDDVNWNAVGDPVGGTAGTGAATITPVGTGVTYMGTCILAAASGDTTVRVKLVEVRRKRRSALVVAAAGSTQADAAQLIEGFNHVTGADATKGVLLPLAATGAEVIIKNSDVANAILKIWPATGDGVNAIAVNSSMSIAAKTSVILNSIDGTTWFTTPLLPS